MATRRQFDWSAITATIKNKESKASYGDDQNFYKPVIKEDGTSQAIIRFLPPPVNEDLPFIKLYSHAWKDINGWFINNCPTTIGKQCVICKENSRIWESDEKRARPRARKPSFYANILVIKDPQTPANEGKVFKFRYGVKIHEKIMEKLSPENPDIDPMIPIFDYDKGANFKLKIKTIKSNINGNNVTYPNYDASSFAEPSPLNLSDKELNSIDEKLYSLANIIDPKEFKSYGTLAEEFIKKTGIVVSTNENSLTVDTPVVEQRKTFKEEPSPSIETKNEKSFSEEEEDDDQDFFAKLQK